MKMGFLCPLLSMAFIFMLVLLVSRWDNRAACRLLESSHGIFEPEPDAAVQPTGGRTIPAPKRGRRHVTPLTKKRVAARQGWRCNCGCGKLLDESYEIDHVLALAKGGSNDDSNLQVLNRSCRQQKSALEAQK